MFSGHTNIFLTLSHCRILQGNYFEQTSCHLYSNLGHDRGVYKLQATGTTLVGEGQSVSDSARFKLPTTRRKQPPVSDC